MPLGSRPGADREHRKKVDVRSIDIIVSRGGNAAGHWGVTDRMAVRQQLGVIE